MFSLWLAAKVIPNLLPLLSYIAELLVKIDIMWHDNPCNCCACGSPYTNVVIHATVNSQLPTENLILTCLLQCNRCPDAVRFCRMTQKSTTHRFNYKFSFIS